MNYLSSLSECEVGFLYKKELLSPPSPETGLFLLQKPIFCEGTLQTVTTQGFCMSEDATGEQMIQNSLTLHLLRTEEDKKLFESVYVMSKEMVCKSGTVITIEIADLNQEVKPEDQIAVEVGNCSTSGSNQTTCSFMPITATNISIFCIQYYENTNFTGYKEERCNTHLNLRATIIPNSPMSTATPSYNGPQAVESTVTEALSISIPILVVFFSGVLCVSLGSVLYARNTVKQHTALQGLAEALPAPTDHNATRLSSLTQGMVCNTQRYCVL